MNCSLHDADRPIRAIVIAKTGRADVITKANFHPLFLYIKILYLIYPTKKPLKNVAIENPKVITLSPIASDIADISEFTLVFKEFALISSYHFTYFVKSDFKYYLLNLFV